MIRKAFAFDYRQWLDGLTAKLHATKSPWLGPIRRLGDAVARLNLTIRTKILLALGMVIFMLGATNAVLMFQMLNYSRQYDAIINNITTANSMNGYIKPAIDSEMWDVVAGKTDFTRGTQYQIIDGVNSRLQWMAERATSAESRIKLELGLCKFRLKPNAL